MRYGIKLTQVLGALPYRGPEEGGAGGPARCFQERNVFRPMTSFFTGPCARWQQRARIPGSGVDGRCFSLSGEFSRKPWTWKRLHVCAPPVGWLRRGWGAWTTIWAFSSFLFFLSNAGSPSSSVIDAAPYPRPMLPGNRFRRSPPGEIVLSADRPWTHHL